MTKWFAYSRAFTCSLALLLMASFGCAGQELRGDSSSPETPERKVARDKIAGPQWMQYYEALNESSRKPGRMLLLFFTTNSCGPCKMMEKWTLADDRVLEALKDYDIVKIGGDVNSQILRRFGVHTFPTLVFARIEDGEIDRKVGYRDADSLLQWMEEVKAGTTTIRALNEKLKREPEDLPSLIRQARNLADADEIDRALALADRASELAPADPDVLSVIGLCHLKTEEFEEADAAVTAALRADPHNEQARRLKTTILLERADKAYEDGDEETAMKLLSSALESNPASFDACIGAGRIYLKAGKNDEAIAMFQKASVLRPGSPVPWAALGDAYRQAGDDGTAEKSYLNAISVNRRYDVSYFRLMEIYEKEGRREDLMKMYEKALAVEPAGAHNEIAWFMAVSKHPNIFNPGEATRHATIAVELEPHPWYLDTLAETYYANGNYDLAIAIIKEAMAKEPTDMQYYRDQLDKFQKAKKQASAD